MKEKEVYVNKDKNIKVTFMGKIDKVLYKEKDDITYLVVIDYKTGSTNINLKNMEYGLGLQLPIYLYLSSKMELKNVKVVGFYLQKLFNTTLDNSKDYDTARENNLRLEGYSIDEENILSKFATTYNDSKLIQGMKTTSKGFSSYSKGLSEEEINDYVHQMSVYKTIINGGVAFKIRVLNKGTAKATDIRISIVFPKDIFVYDIDDIEKMKEPKAPKLPPNPIEKAEERFMNDSNPTYAFLKNSIDGMQPFRSLPVIDPAIFSNSHSSVFESIVAT